MSNKPHISFILNDIHFGGGGERVAVNLANQFALNNYQVSILSIGSLKSNNIFSLEPGITIEYLNIDLTRGAKVIKIFKRIRSIFEIREFYKKRTNIILLGVGTYPSILIALLSKRKNLKTIGCDHTSYCAVSGLWALLRKRFYPRLSALISLTERDFEKLKRHNSNVYVIPNSVTFYPPVQSFLDKKIIIAVGRISYEKGIDLLLDIYDSIHMLIPGWKLRLIGDGKQKKEFEKRVKVSAVLSDKIEFIGYTDLVEQEYINASVYVMTSRVEGFPMVLLEAQSYGLPVVAFDCETGPSDIVINGRNGFIIPNFNKELMGIKIVELCSDFSLRKTFGENARQDVKSFLPELIIKKWEILFEQLFE